jgi:predicted permease
LLLTVGAGLFARSFGNLTALPLGVEEQVLWVPISPGTAGYDPKELPTLYRRILDRVTALPGVQSATIAMCGVMTGCRSAADGLAIEGYTAQPGEQLVVQENRVGDHYFATVGMRIVAGRDFTTADIGSGKPIAIVNEAMVKRYFNGGDAIGKRFGYDQADTEIIGVVRDARVNTVREPVPPMAFYPFTASPGFVGSMHVRSVGNPETTGQEIQKALRELEPKLPVDRARTIASLAAATLRQERLIARLTTVLGGLALALACLGLYGLMAYAVKQRTAELGIRFALGAPRPRVLWMVFRESLMLMAAGLAIGIPLVAAISRLIGRLLFDVSPSDPTILGAAVLALLAVGALSSYLPAWRASRVDPLTALRQD